MFGGVLQQILGFLLNGRDEVGYPSALQGLGLFRGAQVVADVDVDVLTGVLVVQNVEEAGLPFESVRLHLYYS